MTCRSMFTPISVNREKKVICEEIKEVEDNPADLVHDIFSATFWGTHPLGQPILGTKKRVLGLTRSHILTYLRQNYRAGSIVVAAAGFVSHSKLIELVKRYFDFPEGTVATPLPARRAGRTRSKLVTDSNSQTHLCIGYPGLAFTDSCKTAALALNAYLGGGMSSVLFQKIREDLGLAYSVFTYHDFYRDSGVVGAYLGTDRKHVRQALDVILAESDRLKRRRLPSARLDQVRSQMKGQLALSLESTSGRMSRLARQELMGQPYQSYRQLLREVDRLTSSDILHLANRLFDHSQAAITVLGPADKKAFRHAL